MEIKQSENIPIDFIDIKSNKQYKKDVKKLYKQAFPREERIPFGILKMLSKKNGVEFYGIYEYEKFIGLVYLISYKNIIYVFYFAIDETLQGQGYGSKVLEIIKNKYNNYIIVLSIEKVDKNSNNYEQRIRRKKFYKRNGFYKLNFNVKEGGVTYELLCYNKENKKVTENEYRDILKKYFSFKDLLEV